MWINSPRMRESCLGFGGERRADAALNDGGNLVRNYGLSILLVVHSWKVGLHSDQSRRRICLLSVGAATLRNAIGICLADSWDERPRLRRITVDHQGIGRVDTLSGESFADVPRLIGATPGFCISVL